MDFKSIVSAIPPLARGKEALNFSEFSESYCNRSPPICQVFFGFAFSIDIDVFLKLTFGYQRGILFI